MRFRYLIAIALFVSVVSYALVNNQQQEQQQPAAPEFVHHTNQVDINTADLLMLQQLKGIGRKKAKAIVTYRNQHGEFATLDDLSQVPGINRQTVRKLREQLTVG